jgi:hypothetical protein
MSRSTLARALSALAILVLTSGAAVADPVITSLGPGLVAANVGSSITITGTGFGAGDDRIWFPGTNNWVNPTGWGAGSVTCTVPATWSGNVQVQSHGAGNLSNGWLLDITFSYSGNKWAALPVHWRLNPAGAPGNTFGDTYAALAGGLDTWSCASGFSHVYDGTSANATGVNDGVQVMAWSNTGWSPGTIAVTTWWYIGPTKVDADIAFNAQHYTWAVNGAAGSMDIQNIGTHEEGHFIGFLDMYGADDAPKTMYGYGSNGEVQKRALDEADVEGAEYMYPHGGRANFAAGTPAGWYSALVPRSTNDATGAFAPLSATLPGEGTSYLNLAMANNGADCASPWGTEYIYVDDDLAWSTTWSGIWGAGATYGLWTNLGQYVRGGRHTLRAGYDILNEVPESNEFDNRVDYQYVWSPYGLADQAPVARVVPPVPGPFGTPNCDGYQVTGNWWSAVAVMPTASNDDYDLRLFSDYANSTTGFAAPLAYSSYGQGQSDFVVTNGNVAGYGVTRWAGVVRYVPGTSSFGNYIVQQSNQVGATLYPSTTYGATVTTGTVTVNANDIIKVHELYLGSTTTNYTVRLVNLSGSADLNISLYDAATASVGKGSYLASSQALGGGTNEVFTFTPPAIGYYGLVVWKRGSSDIGQANTYRIDVGATLTDLQAAIVPSGFDGTAVPRNDATAAYGNAHVSPVLDGNTADTWVSFASNQVSPNANTPAWVAHVNLDDDYVIWGSVGANALTAYTAEWLDIGTLWVRGGRHSLNVVDDPDLLVPELDETNNLSNSFQYVWSPLVTSRAVANVRGVPPSTGLLALPNGDGFAFTRTPGYAWVVSSAPTTLGDDYDLYVYGDYAGSTSGFSSQIGASYYGGQATDFVVGNYSGTPSTVYPELVRFSVGGGGNIASVDQTDSNLRDYLLPHSYLNQVMDGYRLADVYEAYMVSGNTYYFQTVRGGGTSTMAFAVFSPASGSIAGRGGALAYSTPADPVNASLTYSATGTGYHPVVVFRTDGSSSSTPVTYSLYMSTSALAAGPEPLPTQVEFSGAAPNPFLDRTRFEFALPTATPVRLELYDIGGRRVRSLLDGPQSAGRQSVTWDGRSDAGVRVDPGVYWARLEVGGRTYTRRIALLR